MKKDATKILIIEDEPTQQQAYRVKLGESYQLTFATTEAEARTAWQSESPDLIILDIMLPGGKNGFDILTELKNDSRMREIPVIMLTNLDQSQKATAMAMGATEYILKTAVGPEEIEEIVNSCLEGKQK